MDHHTTASSLATVPGSSTEMLLDEDTAPQGQFLQAEDIEFGPMPYSVKQAIEAWVTSLGVRCEFNADNISNAL